MNFKDTNLKDALQTIITFIVFILALVLIDAYVDSKHPHRFDPHSRIKTEETISKMEIPEKEIEKDVDIKTLVCETDPIYDIGGDVKVYVTGGCK